MRSRLLLPSALVLGAVSAPLGDARAQSPTQTPVSAPAARAGAARQMTLADIRAWRTVRNPTLSSDGRWFAYHLAPNDGDGRVVIRQTADGGKEHQFSVGALPAAGGGGGGAAAAAGAPVALSGDGQWAAFLVYPSQAEARRARTQRRTLYNKAALVNLASGEKREFDRVRRFAFNGERASAGSRCRATPPEAAAPAGGGAPSAAAARRRRPHRRHRPAARVAPGAARS